MGTIMVPRQGPARTPKWAEWLAWSAVDYWNGSVQDKKQPPRPYPRLVWKHGRGSGACWSNGTIVIRSNGHHRYDRMTLLHEVAHHLVGCHHAHDATFWDAAWRLYRWARLPLLWVLERQASYRAGAIRGYERVCGRRAPAGIRRRYRFPLRGVRVIPPGGDDGATTFRLMPSALLPRSITTIISFGGVRKGA